MKKKIEVTSCEQMVQLANEGKSVFVKQWNKHSPAAFIASWQTRLLVGWIQNKQFTVYEPLPKSKLPFAKSFGK